MWLPRNIRRIALGMMVLVVFVMVGSIVFPSSAQAGTARLADKAVAR